jgi:hypothetical protein
LYDGGDKENAFNPGDRSATVYLKGLPDKDETPKYVTHLDCYLIEKDVDHNPWNPD